MSSECSFRDESKWEVIVSPAIGIDRAEYLLNRNLNGEMKLQFDVYEHVSSEFVRSADEGNGAQSNKSHCSKLFKNVPLTIGVSLERGITNAKNFTMKTTIGAYFIVKDKHNEVYTCAFTNCENTRIKSDCCVIKARNSIPVGQVSMTLEGNIPTASSNTKQTNGACASGSDESSSLTNIYHDAMLVDISAGNLFPSNYIKVRKCKANLLPKIYDGPIICDSNFENERVVKINSQITGQPDGCIRSTKLSFRSEATKEQYSNVISISPRVGEPGVISEFGDCGTLIGSVPGRGDHHIYVYGSIFGARLNIRKKDKHGNIITDCYTVAYPMGNLIPQLLKKYPCYQSIELLSGKE